MRLPPRISSSAAKSHSRWRRSTQLRRVPSPSDNMPRPTRLSLRLSLFQATGRGTENVIGLQFEHAGNCNPNVYRPPAIGAEPPGCCLGSCPISGLMIGALAIEAGPPHDISPCGIVSAQTQRVRPGAGCRESAITDDWPTSEDSTPAPP